MGTFVVLLHEEQESTGRVRERIVDAFSDSDRFKFSDTVYLVFGASDTSEVMDKLQMDDDEGAFAAILSLNGSFGGRSWSNLWDWLREADARR